MVQVMIKKSTHSVKAAFKYTQNASIELNVIVLISRAYIHRRNTDPNLTKKMSELWGKQCLEFLNFMQVSVIKYISQG